MREKMVYPSPDASNAPSNDPGYPPPPYGYPPPSEGCPLGPMMKQPVPGVGYPPPGTHNLQHQMQPVAGSIYPPGLEYLSTIDQILIPQKIELLEGCETKNQYAIKNSLGQQIYFAKEQNDCCTQNCAGPALRPFDMTIKDNAGNEVIHLYRPCRCSGCCCPCCLQEMEVMAPPGNVIGTVIEEWSFLAPSFTIKNAAGEKVLGIKGPICQYAVCADLDFKVHTKDGEKEVGCIRKQWSGLVKEIFTDADHFGITFPLDLDVNMKATLLGACMLIDYMYYEWNDQI